VGGAGTLKTSPRPRLTHGGAFSLMMMTEIGAAMASAHRWRDQNSERIF
jgi:hypothetical protein